MLLRSLMQPTSVGASALVECDGKLVLVRQSYTDGWHFPGGGVEPGEAPIDAAVREAQEEIGLVAGDPPELFGIYSRKVGLVSNFVFLYRIRGARFVFKPNWEIRAVRQIDPFSPPVDIGRAVARRLAEYRGEVPVSHFW